MFLGNDELPPNTSDARPVDPSASCEVTSTRASGSWTYGVPSVASVCAPSRVVVRIVESTNAENSPVTSPPFRVRSPPWPGSAVADTNDATDLLCRSEPVMLPTACCVGVQSRRASIDAWSVCRRPGTPQTLIGMPRADAAVVNAETESREMPSPCERRRIAGQ